MTPLEALWRCQRAWERTQPQLFWTPEVLWPDGLDAGQDSHPLPCVEPAVAVASPEAGGLASRLTAGMPREETSECFTRGASTGEAETHAGMASGTRIVVGAPAVSRVLNPGAEPCRDLLGTDGESALITAAPAHGTTEPRPRANGSAAGASAPSHNTTGPHALPPKRTRAAQRRSF